MNSSYDIANNEKKSIMDNALITAYAVTSILGRKEDDISENEAFELYGRAWIKDRAERGMLHYNRVGTTKRSAKMYSRFEIEALKLAEKRMTERVKEAAREVERLQRKNT